MKRIHDPSNTNKTKSANAYNAKISSQQRLHAWQRHHKQIACDSIKRLYRRPWTSLATIAAIAIALSLPAFLWLATQSLQKLDQQFDQATQLLVYTYAQLPNSQLSTLVTQVNQFTNVGTIKTITAEMGLRELEQNLGIENTLSLLGENPLPDTLIITPRYLDHQSLEQLTIQLRQLPQVAEVQLDTVWLERLFNFKILLQRVTLGLMLLFGCGVLLICGNTIRLEISQRHTEIQVVSLLGATAAFIRRPFVYQGAWLGLAGGIGALILVSLALMWLRKPAQLFFSSQDFITLFPTITFSYIVVLLCCSTLLGVIGAWLAVSHRQLILRKQANN